MKILSIGNSFSEDAQAYLHAMDERFYCVNLYIPGCSLAQHWANVEADAVAYVWQENGRASERIISIRSALTAKRWDIVTLQQVSGDSGILESYSPYIEQLSTHVQKLAPHSEQWIHETWAYEVDSNQEAFSHYQRSSEQMYHDLAAAYAAVAKRLSLSLIPVGDIIQVLRDLPAFSPTEGGLSLCRDSYHLSLDYGRYAAAAIWLQALGGNLRKCHFRPVGTDPALISHIKGVVLGRV